MPPFDVLSAVEVLGTGKFPHLPGVIKVFFSASLFDVRRRSHQCPCPGPRRGVFSTGCTCSCTPSTCAARSRSASTSESVFTLRRLLIVERGRLWASLKDMFEVRHLALMPFSWKVSLTLTGPELAWRLLSIDVLVANPSTLHVPAGESAGILSQHLHNLARAALIAATCHTRLITVAHAARLHDMLSKRLEASQVPFHPFFAHSLSCHALRHLHCHGHGPPLLCSFSFPGCPRRGCSVPALFLRPAAVLHPPGPGALAVPCTTPPLEITLTS
jgi:hypothetical protein